jgi:hypothetical protein
VFILPFIFVNMFCAWVSDIIWLFFNLTPPSHPASAAICPCEDAGGERRDEENEDRTSGCDHGNGIIVRSPLALFIFASFSRHSRAIARYKQMQQETQEYFMKLPPITIIFCHQTLSLKLTHNSTTAPSQLIYALLISVAPDRYVAELNEAARRREAKHKERLQQVQSSISS